MRLGEIDVPEELLDDLRMRKLVVFAGAGVSMGEPANLPGFGDFAREIARGTGEIKSGNETEDQFLGRLQYRKQKVHERAARILSQKDPQPTSLHYDLLRVFSESGHVRLITTNFDTLFEQAAEGMFDSPVRVYGAPALPLGNDFEGIVHVHGSICEPNRMVLSDADFGKAYIAGGWASRFLTVLFESFTVLFVGYSYSDIVMKYLARSLTPKGSAKRFILIEEGGEESWGELGVNPIEFRNLQEDNYRVLYEGVNCLAAYANRSRAEWQATITEMAQVPPPSSCDSKVKEMMREVLSDLWRTRIFCKAAKDPGWIEWLDDNKYLANLFDSRGEPLSRVDLRLSYWLSDTFAFNYSDDLFLPVSRHGMNLHPDFWNALGGTIASGSAQAVKPEMLSRWVSLLLACSHNDRGCHIWHQLGLKCAEAGQFHSLVEIFNEMAKPQLIIDQGIDTQLYKTSFRVWAETNLRFSFDQLGTLWNCGLKPNLPEVVDSVMVSTVGNLSAMYRTFRSWHPEDYEEDYVSSSRLDLESGGSEPVDVLIDATRDCLAYLSDCRPEASVEWCKRLIDCGVPILRRLSLHAFTQLEDCSLSPDAKLEWLLQNVGVHDLAAKGEVVVALQALYPKASERVRHSVISSVLNNVENWSDLSREENEHLNASLHFSWLEVLKAADSDCPLVQDALDVILKHYPVFRKDRPAWTDNRFYRTAPLLFPSLWTVDELLQLSGQSFVEELSLRLEQEDSIIVRNSTLQNVRAATKTNQEWGYRVAESLVALKNWNTLLWVPLLESWSRDSSESLHADVLRLLSNGEVGQKHPNSVAKLLLALVEEGSVSYASSLLSEANQLAELLWSSATDAEVPPEMSEEDWLGKPLTHPAGTLAQFWIKSLSFWYGQQDTKPCSLPPEYLTPLSTILGDNTLAGQVGIMALTERIQLLMDVDQGWCLNSLIPVFYQSESPKYRFAWHGLTPSTFSTCVADKLQDAFLEAASNIDQLFPVNTRILFLANNQLRNSFFQSYIRMMNLIVDDPMTYWVPRILNSFSYMEDGHNFAFEFGKILAELDDKGQCDLWESWLGEYWENRLDNVPYKLAKGEVQGMLNWLPNLTSKYPKAIEFAIQMPRYEIDPDSALSNICEKGLWEDHPEATIKLLDYLAQSESLAWSWHSVDGLMTRLTTLDLSESQESELGDLALSLGMELSDSETNT